MITGRDPTPNDDPLAFLQGGGAMGELIRSRDWRQSELGMPEQWPATLKSAISSVLNSGTAMHISWGDNLLQFYNDAYTPVLTGGKHPAALGRRLRETFPEIWDFVWPLFDRVLNKGESVAMENAPLMMLRDGILTESFFSFSYSPLKSLSNEICGVAAVCWETTEDVIIKRRERGLRLLTEQLAAANTLEAVRNVLGCHVEGNRSDLPFLLWYERDEALKTLRLVDSCGISPGAPLIQELGAKDGRLTLGQVPGSNVPVAGMLPLPEPATEWLLDPPVAMEVERIAIEPLCYFDYLAPDGYLVFGVGPQRPFDGPSQNFHESICRGVERAVRRVNAVELERRERARQFDAVMRMTLEPAHIGYWELDLLTHAPKQSLQHDRIFGYDEPVVDWSYERFIDHVLPQDREHVDRAFKAGAEGKGKWDIEGRITRRDGAQRWIWIHGDVLTNANGDAVRSLGIIVDITDRKKSEESVLQLNIALEQRVRERTMQVEQLRELSQRLSGMEETERRNISRELHDQVGPNLVALKLSLGMMHTALPADGSHTGALEDAREVLEQTIAQLHNVMSDLRPPALDDYGLLAAIRSYAERYSARLDAEVRVEGADLAPRPSLAVETALFRIAQEALNNIAKHAKARRVVIAAQRNASGIALTITDDGVGFDVASVDESGGLGLRTMRERAQGLGAVFSVESRLGGPTRIAVDLASEPT